MPCDSVVLALCWITLSLRVFRSKPQSEECLDACRYQASAGGTWPVSAPEFS